MKILKSIFAVCALGIVALATPAVRSQTVHTGADVDTKIRIGYPDYQHEVLQHSCVFMFWCESHRHSWLPNPSNWAAQAEAHAKRLHVDLPWPLPDVEWQSVWGGNYLRNGYNPKSAGHKAAAWGSWFIIDGPPGEMAEFRARIPAVNSIDPPPAGIPSQGMYADSFFDIFVDVHAAVDVPGVGLRDLLAIRNTWGGPASPTPGLNFTEGDWAAPFFDVTDTVSPGGEPRKQAMVIADILSPVSVMLPTNTPFHVDWTLSLESEIMTEVELLEGVVIGTAASFGMQLELADLSGRFNLRPIPEPMAISLAALGLAAMFCRRAR